MLLLDIGNSAVKGQCWRDERLQFTFYSRFIRGWQQRFETSLGQVRCDRCYYTSVLGGKLQTEINNSLARFFDQTDITRLEPMDSCLGLRNAYQSPTALGADRWFALLGTAALTRQDAIIVDAGSAITVDLLQGNGLHLGGAILPGFNTSLKRFREILHRADFEHPDIAQTDAPGLTTEACIHINHGLTDDETVGRLVQRWFGRLAPDATLIVTGGDADLIPRSPPHAHQIIPDLVFRGMRRQLESLR